MRTREWNWRVCTRSSATRKTAELQLQQALQLDQTNKRAWTAMAYLRESKGDVQQALANYQRAYALDGYNPTIANRIAALNKSSSGATGVTRRARRTGVPGAPAADRHDAYGGLIPPPRHATDRRPIADIAGLLRTPPGVLLTPAGKA